MVVRGAATSTSASRIDWGVEEGSKAIGAREGEVRRQRYWIVLQNRGRRVERKGKGVCRRRVLRVGRRWPTHTLTLTHWQQLHLAKAVHAGLCSARKLRASWVHAKHKHKHKHKPASREALRDRSSRKDGNARPARTSWLHCDPPRASISLFLLHCHQRQRLSTASCLTSSRHDGSGTRAARTSPRCNCTYTRICVFCAVYAASPHIDRCVSLRHTVPHSSTST